MDPYWHRRSQEGKPDLQRIGIGLLSRICSLNLVAGGSLGHSSPASPLPPAANRVAEGVRIVFGLLPSSMIASAAMSLSSVSVIANALRLRHAQL